jgi:hypothetical protein
VRISDLTPEALAALRAPRPYPAVTLAMPTDPKFSMSSEHSRILLRDLLTEAKRRLADDPDVDRDARLELRDRLLLPEVVERAGDPFHPGEALVAYVAAGEPVQVWQVPSLGPVGPRVEFADHFLTRYLVGADQRSWPYLVLVLDLELCRLFRGAADWLGEVTTNGFPSAPRIPSPQDAVPGPIENAAPYEDHGERVKQYLRAVDAHAGQALKAHEGLPLFVVGGDKLLAIFEQVTGYGDLIAGTLPLAGMAEIRPADLAKRVAPVVAEFRAKQVAEAVTELEDARGRSKYVGGAPEVWTAVADGRVYRLVVEESLVVAGKVDDDGRVLHLVPTPEQVTMPDPKEDVTPPQPGVATDVVEQLVERATETDARVLFVPDGTLADAGGIAAVLRY